MVGLHQLQSGYLHIQVHTLLNTGVSGTQGLDFRKRQCGFIYIITGAYRRFRSHDLADKFLLILHSLPQVGIKGSLRHIAVHMDKGVLVALALDTAFALGKVSRPPRAIQIMERHKAVLHIGASAHLCGAAQQDAHLSGTDFGEQLFFPYFGIGLMDESNLVGGHPLGNQFLSDVLIDRKGPFRLR